MLPQGLANMLWAYSRLPVGSPMLLEVVQSLVECITQQLDARHDHNRPFDAQVCLRYPRTCLQHVCAPGD